MYACLRWYSFFRYLSYCLTFIAILTAVSGVADTSTEVVQCIAQVSLAEMHSSVTLSDLLFTSLGEAVSTPERRE